MVSTAECALRLLMILGPMKREKTRAVINAAIDLKVTYLNTLKMMLYSVSG